MNSSDEDNLPVFRHRMQIIDRLRGEDFAVTFPEMGDLMCE